MPRIESKTRSFMSSSLKSNHRGVLLEELKGQNKQDAISAMLGPLAKRLFATELNIQPNINQIKLPAPQTINSFETVNHRALLSLSVSRFKSKTKDEPSINKTLVREARLMTFIDKEVLPLFNQIKSNIASEQGC